MSKINIPKKYIHTVQGSIAQDKLGWCQCHEHIFIAKGQPYNVNNTLYMEDLDASYSELTLYHQVGGAAIVDAQPVGCGRMAEYLLKASEASGVHIIASTGFHMLRFYIDSHWLNTINDEALAQLFISEITDGMYLDVDSSLPNRQSEIPAGIIKVALDSVGITGRYELLFSAVAQASIVTGASILCHIEQGSEALELIKFFTSRGINPSKLILCHLDRARFDITYHKEIAASGVFLEYDTIGRPKYHTDEQEAELITDMLSAGYTDNILLGLDTTRARLKCYNATMGLDYLFTDFIPRLMDCGVSKECIDTFMVKNPQRALAF